MHLALRQVGGSQSERCPGRQDLIPSFQATPPLPPHTRQHFWQWMCAATPDGGWKELPLQPFVGSSHADLVNALGTQPLPPSCALWNVPSLPCWKAPIPSHTTEEVALHSGSSQPRVWVVVGRRRVQLCAQSAPQVSRQKPRASLCPARHGGPQVRKYTPGVGTKGAIRSRQEAA